MAYLKTRTGGGSSRRIWSDRALSEGGVIAPLVAAKNHEIAFITLLDGAGSERGGTGGRAGVRRRSAGGGGLTRQIADQVSERGAQGRER